MLWIPEVKPSDLDFKKPGNIQRTKHVPHLKNSLSAKITFYAEWPLKVLNYESLRKGKGEPIVHWTL